MSMFVVGPTPEIDARMRREMEEAARAREETHRQRRERLTAVLFALGADAPGVLSDRQALEEAAAEVSGSWERLIQLEEQVGRERQRLALLEAGLKATPEPRKPFESTLDLRQADARNALAVSVETAQYSVAALSAEAKAKRAELERLAKKR
jgi:hypothetical protein